MYTEQDEHVQKRVMNTFKGLMNSVHNQVQLTNTDYPEGFFFIPLHRLLAVFLARMVVKDCVG